MNQAYDEQLVIGVQRELPFNMFLSASYVHTHDIHLPATLESAQQSLKYSFVNRLARRVPLYLSTNSIAP